MGWYPGYSFKGMGGQQIINTGKDVNGTKENNLYL